MSGTAPPTDPNPTLRAQLMASLAVIEPQIRGLIDLRATPEAVDLSTAMTAQITQYQNRQALIQNVINDLNQAQVDMLALEANGWPAPIITELPPSTFAELISEMSDLAAAAATFAANGPAAVEFDDTVPHTDVPQPVPDQTIVAGV